MIRRLATILVLLLAMLGGGSAFAQAGPPAPGAAPAASTGQAPAGTTMTVNPLQALEDASSLLPGLSPRPAPGVSPEVDGPGVANPDSDRPGLSVAINVMLVLTVIALVPSIMLMTTCFVRILIVLSLLRQAMGTQQLPPAQVVTGLAMFMTVMVMQPTIDRVWNEAVVPYQNGEVTEYDELWARGVQPLRDYMFDQIEATDNWTSLYALLEYRGIDISEPSSMTRADVPTGVLIPAYMLSELKVGFIMGFRVYLPFLVIDMVIASILISMSMMMLPPVLISLPFKLLLFIMVDGWTLVISSLLESFVIEGVSTRASAEPASAAALLFLVVGVRAAGKLRAHGPSLPVSSPEARRPGRCFCLIPRTSS